MSEVMSEVTFDAELDARGLNCPMPLVKARKQIGSLDAGQVLKIVSTDRGSIKDFQGWAKIAANIELLAQETATENDQDLFLHYVKRVN
jgi:TusA-related sulfurtransferase